MSFTDWTYTAQTAEKADFRNNTNALGMPSASLQAVRDCAALCESYPDAACSELCRAIAGQWGAPPDWVLCGAGADDLIYRICQSARPKRALVIIPTYEGYEAALRSVGCEVEVYTLRAQNSFRPGCDLLSRITPGIELVFLCNPNNPTGQCISPDLLRSLIAACEERGVTLVVDESFLGFLEDARERSSRRYLGESRRLLVVDAFTKLYAMPGLRVGYCMSSNTELLRVISASGQPTSISIPAQAAALAALRDSDYLHRTLQLLREERPWLRNGLHALGVKSITGEANFLFFPSPLPHLRERMERFGMQIRDCSAFRGLPEEYCRVPVGQREMNSALLHKLKFILRCAADDADPESCEP